MDSLTFAAGAVGVSVLALVVYVGLGVVRSGERSSARLISLQSREDLLQQSFAERALAPLVSKLGGFFMRFTPQGWGQRATQRLVIAGWAPRVDANSWASVRVVAIVAAVIGIFVAQGFVSGGQKLAVAGLLGLAGLFGPEAVLSRRIDERKAAVEQDLPDVIDLLVISVEAGLGFEAALGRVVENVPGELSDEFARMLQETRVGVSRHDAMKSLAERTDVDDLNSFIFSMNQADQFGVSIARMLRVQADEIRVRRRQRAQERAFAAPVKMVFPLVLFIFPSVFLVLLGPAVIQIIDNLNL
ncbi:MAG: type II secretion system F family protein [Acidimicrobiia bacterium]